MMAGVEVNVVLSRKTSPVVVILLTTNVLAEDMESALVKTIVIVTGDGGENIVETRHHQKPVGVFHGLTIIEFVLDMEDVLTTIFATADEVGGGINASIAVQG